MMPMPMESVSPAVEFEQVSFAHRPGVGDVLGGVSFACRSGETVAIVGRSGAGKTTLLRLVNRLIEPSGGSVRVMGRDTREWEPVRLRRSIGYVMQDAGLFPHMTVAENVATLPGLEGWAADRTTSRVREVLALVGLDPDIFTFRRPSQLSGGQRQRVGLARALAIDPPVLLMDEPFGALDPMTRREVRAAFISLRQRLQTTALVVTHDIDEAFAMADRVAVLDGGGLVTIAPPDEIRRSSDPRVRLLLEDPS